MKHMVVIGFLALYFQKTYEIDGVVNKGLYVLLNVMMTVQNSGVFFLLYLYFIPGLGGRNILMRDCPETIYSAGKVCPNPTNDLPSCDSPPCTCPGFWGRRCEYRLECVNSSDLCAYRGTVNTSSAGDCKYWQKYDNKNPSDGKSNYCRKADQDDYIWCYPVNGGRWSECNVPDCDTQCPPPELPIHGKVMNPPRVGFRVGSNLTIDCENGYYKDGPHKIHCNAGKQWSGAIPECRDINECKSNPCGTSAVCQNTPGSYSCRCPVGYTGDPESLCNDINECKSNPCGALAICQNTPGSYSCRCPVGYTGDPESSCNVVTCLFHREPHSFTEQNLPSYNYSEIVRVICDPGYETFQKNNVTVLRCQENGLFNKSIPVCKVRCPVHCDKMAICSTSEDHACPYGKCIGYWGRFCEYPLECLSSNASHYRGTMNTTKQGTTCDRWDTPPPKVPGYTLPPAELHPENYCRHADNTPGVWCYTKSHSSNRYETCHVPNCGNHCSAPNLSAHSIVQHPPRGGFTAGRNITITCKPGFLLFGSTTLTCNRNKTWSNEAPVCKEICQQLSPGIHSSITPGNKTFVVGDVLKVVCDNGYETNSQTTFICNSDKSWNGTLPDCTAICDVPRIKPHIIIMEKKSKYHLNDAIDVDCDSGYELNGNTHFICQDDRTWNGEMPLCSAICDAPQIQLHSILREKKSKYGVNDTIDVECEPGYEFIGNKHFVCQDDRTWSGEMPLCSKSSTKSNVAGAVGGAIGAVIAAIIVIIVIIVLKRRKNNSKNDKSSGRIERCSAKEEFNLFSDPSKSDQSTRDPPEKIYENEGPDGTLQESSNTAYYAFTPGMAPSKNAIKVENFKDRVCKILEDEELAFKEYATLKSDLQQPTIEACRMKNKRKNKYKNMYPYDDNRVKLKARPGHDGSDYINASYINGSNSYRKYIAAQGPIESSVDDFWSMVWQLKTEHIVMLTNVVEEGKQKCVQYWPTDGSLKFDDILVSLIKEDVRSDFIIREMSLKKGGVDRNITQYHFTVWPDKGVPKFPSSLASFHSKVVSMSKECLAPLVVHCSAGIGRTGTFIALDYLMDQSAATGHVDVLGCVETLRRQRVNMVQTKEQYKYLHEALLDSLMHSQSKIPTYGYANYYQMLQKKGKQSIDNLYVSLQDVTPQIDEKEFATGKRPENRKKNRFSNILAVESERPFLSTDSDKDTNYINAVFLPSTKNRKAFLVTQMPLPHTVMDFWKLVYEQDVKSIVMLNKDTDNTCGVYWPTSKEGITKFGPFSIEIKDSQTYNIGNKVSMELLYGGEKRIVQHFRCTFWPDDCTVPVSVSPLLNLVKLVETTKNADDVTIIHCLNGAEKSGLYCTIATAIQQMETEQELDLQQIIRRLRHARPQIIPNVEQFRFCHETVMEYLNQDQSNIYQNVN